MIDLSQSDTINTCWLRIYIHESFSMLKPYNNASPATCTGVKRRMISVVNFFVFFRFIYFAFLLLYVT